MQSEKKAEKEDCMCIGQISVPLGYFEVVGVLF